MLQTGFGLWCGSALHNHGMKVGELCFRAGFKLGSFFHIINFSEGPLRSYKTFEQSWKHIIYYISILVVLLLTMFHVTIAAEEVYEKGITVSVIITLVYAVVYVCTFVFIIAIYLCTHEIIEFLNATFSILKLLSDLKKENVTPFSKYKVIIETIPPLFLSVEIVILMTSMSLYYTNISAQLATALIRRDLLPTTLFGNLGWRIALLPLEFLHCCVPACVIVISGHLICVGVAANATVAGFIRFAAIILT